MWECWIYSFLNCDQITLPFTTGNFSNRKNAETFKNHYQACSKSTSTCTVLFSNSMSVQEINCSCGSADFFWLSALFWLCKDVCFSGHNPLCSFSFILSPPTCSCYASCFLHSFQPKQLRFSKSVSKEGKGLGRSLPYRVIIIIQAT